MPWASRAQQKWGHSPAGEKALGGPAAVAEWDSATPPGSLSATAKQKGSGKQPMRPRGVLGKRFIQGK